MYLKTSIILAAMICLQILLPINSCAAGAEITGAGDKFGVTKGTLEYGTTSRTVQGLAGLDFLGSVYPGTEIFIPLDTKDFAWKDKNNKLDITSSTARFLGIEVWKENGTGSEIIKSFKLAEKDDKYGLLIVFTPYYDSIDPLEFSFKAGIIAGGSMLDGLDFTVSGKFTNRMVSVMETTSSEKIGAGMYVKAYADVENLKLDIGCGVMAIVNIGFYDCIYARAYKTVKAADKKIMENNPEISGVVHIESTGLSGKVNLGMDNSVEVYDFSMKLLGRGDGLLPFRSAYYYTSGK